MTKKRRDDGGPGGDGLGLDRCGAAAAARPPSPSSPTNPKQVQNIPLELQVVISRYQGDKRVSSLPYVLSLKSSIVSRDFRPGVGASLRLGSRVPVRTQVVRSGCRREARDDVQLGQLRERGHEHRCGRLRARGWPIRGDDHDQ